jgi:hypothetical protein
MSRRTLKGLGSLANLHDLRTAGTVRRSGKPPLPTTAILELSMRRNERDRLIKETLRLKKRRQQVDRRLRELHAEMRRLYDVAVHTAASLHGAEVKAGGGGGGSGARRVKKRGVTVRY